MAVSVPHFSKTACSIFFGFGLCIASLAASGYRGVIDDPDSFVNLRADAQPDAAIIAKLKTGERVSFECQEGDKWCNITLASRQIRVDSIESNPALLHRKRFAAQRRRA